MIKPIIEVKNISKKYALGERQPYYSFRDTISGILHTPFKRENLEKDEFWALKDVSFDINEGDVVGVIGRNGAGKSTLLKILSQITPPTDGEIKLRGRVASLLEVGTGFHPELTGRENIYLNGAILGMKRGEINNKFKEIVEFAEIEKFLDTPVKHYSSGMYMRLAFSIAAHLEPEILLVDEVLAVGDAQFQKKCLGKMSDVSKQGRTVIFVSHNMGAISSLCKQTIWMDNGLLKKMGDTKKLVSEYLFNSEENSILKNNIIRRDNTLNPVLTKFKIINKEIIYGNDLDILIGYKSKETIFDPQFCLIFFDVNGTKVFSLVSSYQENNIPRQIQGEGAVKCSIYKLPLLPGSYTITANLWQPGRKIDEIEDIARINVSWGKTINSNTAKWNSGFGQVYVDATWKNKKL